MGLRGQEQFGAEPTLAVWLPDGGSQVMVLLESLEQVSINVGEMNE